MVRASDPGCAPVLSQIPGAGALYAHKNTVKQVSDCRLANKLVFHTCGSDMLTRSGSIEATLFSIQSATLAAEIIHHVSPQTSAICLFKVDSVSECFSFSFCARCEIQRHLPSIHSRLPPPQPWRRVRIALLAARTTFRRVSSASAGEFQSHSSGV